MTSEHRLELDAFAAGGVLANADFDDSVPQSEQLITLPMPLDAHYLVARPKLLGTNHCRALRHNYGPVDHGAHSP
jgi:hypothetical protein